MRVSKSAFYAWQVRPLTLITAADLHIHGLMKELFQKSRYILGSRELTKKLREEGIRINRERTRRLMKQLKLSVAQSVA